MAISSPLGPNSRDVLWYFFVSGTYSGMLPPSRYVLVSAAMEERAWYVGDCSFVGGEGRSVSAYEGKYWVPYGELKHSGRTMRFAPCREASKTLERARVRLADLSAPGVGGG